MSSNPERQQQQQQIQRRRLDDDDHDQDEGAAGQQQQLRRPNSEQSDPQQQHRHEGLLMPMESSPYLRYTDLEDYELKAFGYGAYGTAFHEIEDQEDPLQPKHKFHHPTLPLLPPPIYPAPTPPGSNQEAAATSRLDRKLK